MNGDMIDLDAQETAFRAKIADADRLALAVTALNEAAYAAAKAARKAGHPLADRLRNLAALSDHIKDDL
jgi:hypothetical protein